MRLLCLKNKINLTKIPSGSSGSSKIPNIESVNTVSEANSNKIYIANFLKSGFSGD